MLENLWLVPAVPILGFVILAIFGSKIYRDVAAAIGVTASAASAVLAIFIAVSFLAQAQTGEVYRQRLWTWLSIGNFQMEAALSLDALSIVMILVITCVGFLINLYSWEFMARYEGLARFFAYMNLFIGSMLILVLADNLLFLYLGWEGVGLCSYLLIGFWYKNPDNIRAAIKAFVVTRIGDTAFLIGIIMLLLNFGTLDIRQISDRVLSLPDGAFILTACSALLLAGAIGKSAQLPLQVWLPDAMAGPTPVSALIHAATMVTAGVYLIARMHVLFSKTPIVMDIIQAIGAATLIMAALSAIMQYNIKRILAYSTISQVGYMFMALGAGAFSAAIFHFMTHAFFKSTLFLCAGMLIIALEEEHDIYKMSGFRKTMPFAFWTFLAGALSISAVPIISAGFYSKDLILIELWPLPAGHVYWAIGALGAFFTAIYAFKIIFVAFSVKVREVTPQYYPGLRIKLPVAILAVLSTCAGWIEWPNTLGNVKYFSDFLANTLAHAHMHETSYKTEYILDAAAGLFSLLGIFFAYLLYSKDRPVASSYIGSVLYRFLLHGCGFDWIYNYAFVKPYIWLAAVNRNDFVNYFYSFIEALAVFCNAVVVSIQTGRLRFYAACTAIGAIIYLAMVIFT